MVKKLVFVGVPMNGKTDEEIERSLQMARDFYVHAKGVNAKEVAFIDNFDHGMKDDRYEECKHPSVGYLGRAIKRIALCDEAVFAVAPAGSRGCTIEHKVCSTYDIPFMVMVEKK